jgi:Fe-only nitrogenase accessory protein AnfO
LKLRIAALTCNGILSSIETCHEVNLFEKGDEGWQNSETIPFSLEGSSSAEIRDCMRSLILELGSCSILVGKSIAGLPYHVLDRMGFSIFEAEDLTEGLLNGLCSDFEQAEQEKNRTQSATEPVPLDDQGRWMLDLIALQEDHPEISSKQALRPFLKQPFLELMIICSHLPPWLEQVLPEKRLGYSMETLPNGKTKMTISRSLCKE